ncbi:hypothetical protein ACV1EH_09160 [Aeromonas caviae]
MELMSGNGLFKRVDMEFILGFVSSSIFIGFLSYLAKLLLESKIRADYDVKMEDYRQKIKRNDKVEEIRWQATHEACLDALGLIDTYLSRKLREEPGKRITPQNIEIKVARECHNKLMLACVNIDIVDGFNRIMFENEDVNSQTGFKIPPTDLLNDLRNKIRLELGFGNPLILDRNIAWIGSLSGDEGDQNK